MMGKTCDASFVLPVSLILVWVMCLAQGHMIIRPEIDPRTRGPPPNSDFSPKQVIESFHVYTDIRYRFATTKMTSVVRNTAGTAHEMTFDVTLPKGAFIVSFAMTIDGKVYDGEVKKKSEAKEQYYKAVQQGQSAGHIRQTPRHSNRFDVSVNVANGTAVNFDLTYQQILARKLGVYEYEMHVEPGQAVEDFNVEVFIQENRPLLFVKTPQLRKASTLSNKIEAPNDLTTVDRPTETTAHIQYKPTVRQQGKGGLAARFVVQYDVKHSDNGDVLVADGYFIHMFSPKPQSAIPKDIIFVLDVSGSMSGTKIAQLKDAMKAILEDLTEEDRFNILTFSGEVSPWKRVLKTAKSEVVEEAQQFVHAMTASGGTNINTGLLAALKALQGREVQTRVGMIFFLTDGEATVGETSTSIIARNVKNANVQQTSIYSLAFGQGANFESLKTISTQNFGFARKIYEASDAALQVESLFDEISTVAMKNVTVKYLPTVTKTTETVFPVVQNETEIFIGGCIDLRGFRGDRGVYPGFLAEIEATVKEGDIDIVLEFDDIDEITIDTDNSLNSFFTMPRDYSGIIEKMWAFMTIQQLLKEKHAAVEEKDLVAELDAEILEMSLKYKFVTPLTSMVVTKPDSDSPVHSDLEDLDKPIERYQPRPQAYAPISRLMSKKRFGGGSSRRMMGRARPIYSSMPVMPGSPVSSYSTTGHLPAGMLEYDSPAVTNMRPDIGGRPKPKRKGLKIKKNGGKRKARKVSVGALSSIVLRSNQKSVCLAPKRIPSGKYLLVDGVSSGFKAELITGCLKKCRVVVPEALVLTSSSKSMSINLTSLTSWDYQQHPDFDVTFVKMNQMVLKHQDVIISLVRQQKRKRVNFSVELTLTSTTTGNASSSSAMTALFNRKIKKSKRKSSKVVKFCVKSKADISMFLMKKVALKYKV